MSTSVATVGTTSTTSSTSSTSSTTLGKDDFLKLLCTEMENQNPLDPMSGSEYAAELAQFSEVEQLENIDSDLTSSLSTQESLTQAVSNSLSATLIGKEVSITNDSFEYDGSTSKTLGYTLSSAAESVTVKIYDSDGDLVRTISNCDTSSGDNTVSWDGTDDSGDTVDSGTYTFTVDATDSSGNSITTSTFIYGTIEAVKFKSTGTYFTVDGQDISISNVLEILGS